MAQFESFVPDVEVSGAAVLSIVDAMGSHKTIAQKILTDAGIVGLKADGWYSQQAWLDAFRVIHDRVGESLLFTIGTRIPENALFPSDMDSLEKGLRSIDVAYHMNHRRDDRIMFDPATGEKADGIGNYGYEKKADRLIVMPCGNPYPCDFDRGIIEAMTRKFKPADSLFVRVTHDDTQPCRKQGADACTYRVEW